MDYFSLGFGIIILITIYREIGITALSSNGSGKITHLLTQAVWKCLFVFGGKNGKNPLLNNSIILIIPAILFFWIASIWVANFMIFKFDPNSVVETQTNKAATDIEKLYYVGYTLSTLGNGDFKSNGLFWQLYSILVSLSGLVIITMSITHLLPVLNSDILKKKIALTVASIEVALNKYC